MIRRIHIKGFKSLEDVEVELPPLAIVLGPNSAGKSNFLEALQLLSRLATEQVLDRAFESPLRGYSHEAFTLPATGLPGLLAQDRAELSLEADLEPAERETGGVADGLRYRIAVELAPASGKLAVADELLARLDRAGEIKGKARIEQEPGDSGKAHLAVRRLAEAGHPTYEPLGLNHAIVSNLRYSGEKRYPDLERLRAELGAWRIYYFDPRVAMRAPQPPREVEDIGPLGELLAPFLFRLKHDAARSAAFTAVTRGLKEAIPSVEGLDVDLDPQRGVLDIRVIQHGTPFSSRVLSEGTLRVLALCAVAANPWRRSLIALEEPENGVHPRRLDTIAQLVVNLVRAPGRQVIVTTHSPRFAGVVAALRGTLPLGDKIGFLRTRQVGRATVIETLPLDHPLFQDGELRQVLTDPDDAAALEAAFARGWLDD
jgi:predicted ATPase